MPLVWASLTIFFRFQIENCSDQGNILAETGALDGKNSHEILRLSRENVFLQLTSQKIRDEVLSFTK